jgi:branched-chain amino acid transport system ATP-binding protein
MSEARPLLEVRGLRVSYGGIEAVRGIDLSIAAGEMVCLIGANGAGKTSTLKAIAGLLPVAREAVRFEGVAVGGLKAFELVRRGLALVPEGRGVFSQLSVEENLAMGAYTRTDPDGIAADRARMFELFPRLLERRRQSAGTLSGGEQQMLAIARALMSRPHLLLLDEPSMGLAPLVVARIFEIVGEIARQGVTVLVVEQNARVALANSHDAHIMELGRIVLSGTSAALSENPDVKEFYLGIREGGIRGQRRWRRRKTWR